MVLELILAEVDKQVMQKQREGEKEGGESMEISGMYPSMCSESVMEQVPENVLVANAEPLTLEKLCRKVKSNIATCRTSMAKQKQMESFKDKHRNLSLGRGRGKFGPRKRKANPLPAPSSSPVHEGPLIGNMLRG